ncbi:EFR1 family ferrodoxin [Acutalibacter muris]|uniref:4Fe-4S ferredoxin n=1 Tax=Acutalibacter muris TaxID=1796620 RepID=A0A1Z2XS39_9FIRM|nr:EFR1 family ferrodoxin [Acutalibacter muris]ANU55501.1 4Fe-4S ferredoxin [Hungateiclostridiaceae bacterium KB18]ASB41262.1 4Fe-4S ferredoxin [Acutalibacter muris]QQR30534.1 EFR1 family ferrodoxin [Acutalibacter muris]
MKLVQIVFSPTGGTQKVADILTEKWTGTVTRVDLSDGNLAISDIAIEQEDVALIAVPSYGGRVPGLAAQRLGKLKGNGAKCIIVCVYGNRAYEDTLVELKDIAENCGFQTVAAVSAVAEHSIMHQYATGRPDEKDIEELQGFVETIFEQLTTGKLTASAPELPGNRPYKKAGGAGLVPKADKNCIGCGLCAKSCPAQAINPNNLKTADGKKCISCMRCVVKCPRSARKVNGAMVSAAALAIKKACSERKGNELFL